MFVFGLFVIAEGILHGKKSNVFQDFKHASQLLVKDRSFLASSSTLACRLSSLASLS